MGRGGERDLGRRFDINAVGWGWRHKSCGRLLCLVLEKLSQAGTGGDEICLVILELEEVTKRFTPALLVIGFSGI